MNENSPIVERSVVIEAEPSAVFEALTAPSLITRWLCHESVVEPVSGGRYWMAWSTTDNGKPLRYEGEGRIQAFEPGKLLGLSLRDAPEGRTGSLVTFDLEAQTGGTRLMLRHAGIDQLPDAARMRQGYDRGWASCLQLLRSLLEDPPEKRLLMATMHRDLAVPGDEPCGLAWDGKQLWLSEASSGRIVRLDPDSGQETASLAYDGEPADLAWDGSHLWQVDTDKRALVKIDPNTGRIAATLRVPRDSGELAGLAWDGAGLWVSVSDHDEGVILRLDARTGALTATRPACPAIGGLAWDGTTLWAGDFVARTLARIDPQTGSELYRVGVKGTPTGVAWDGERLWYVDREWGLISRILDLPSGRS